MIQARQRGGIGQGTAISAVGDNTLRFLRSSPQSADLADWGHYLGLMSMTSRPDRSGYCIVRSERRTAAPLNRLLLDRRRQDRRRG